jgi:phosphosulfolactate phosphohydrolase-like enzyme
MGLAESRASLVNASQGAETASSNAANVASELEQAVQHANAAAQDFDNAELTAAVTQLQAAANDAAEIQAKIAQAKQGIDEYVQRMS